MNTSDLAREKIDLYHTIRDGVGLTKNPERSHNLSLELLRILRGAPIIGAIGMAQIRKWCHFPDLESEIQVGNFYLGELRMDYPVGTAAGLFKRADLVPWELFQEGGMQVGFVTVGCSLLDQPGNPKPRHFSFPNKGDDGGSGINRYGLNNRGGKSTADALELARRQNRIPQGLLVIANIFNGLRTLDCDKSWELGCITQILIDQVDAIELNISCPNQAGGTGMQEKIDLLVSALKLVKAEAKGKPIFLKISPDTDEETLRLIIEASKDFVTGYSSTNTTIDPVIRRGLLEREGYGDLIGTSVDTLDSRKDHGKITLLSGGISGDALFPKQLAMTRLIRELAPHHAIMGVGGIGNEKTAKQTIDSGANALAIYSRLALDGVGATALTNLGAGSAMEILRQKHPI